MHNGSGGDGGDLGVIVSRCNFNHVHADKIQTTQLPNNSQRLHAGQASSDRCPGAGRKGGIQAVDIKGQVGR